MADKGLYPGGTYPVEVLLRWDIGKEDPGREKGRVFCFSFGFPGCATILLLAIHSAVGLAPACAQVATGIINGYTTLSPREED